MNKNINVSVVIPVYNAEKYLFDCLNSLINQSFRDLEIICVDDCSTDNSLNILDYFSNKDNRIKVLYNSYKMGPGASRNKGIEIASGEYIQFLDSDDWLDEECIQKLYVQAKNNNLDVLMFKLINYVQDDDIFYKDDYYSMTCAERYFDKCFNYETLPAYLVFKIPNSPCNKLFKTSLIKDNDVKFPEGLIHEDNPFFFEVFFLAKKIMISDNYFYNRRIRSKSITQKRDTSIEDIIPIVNIVLDYFMNNGLYEVYKKYLLNYVIRNLKSKFYLIYPQYKEEFYDLMRSSMDKYLEVYHLGDDFGELLYRPNKRFYNLIIASNNFTDFEKKVNHNKEIKSSYELTLSFIVQDISKKEINRVFYYILKQSTEFDNLELLFVHENSDFMDSNKPMQEINDLYSNVNVLSLDNLINANEIIISKAKGKNVVVIDLKKNMDNVYEILDDIINEYDNHLINRNVFYD